MKKWKTLANPADPSIWADVSNMWPTGRGSYETADYYAASADITATNESGPLISAWAFSGITESRIYVIGEYIWQLDTALTTATDRTGALGANAVASGTGGHACQYGNVSIIARGTAASLIYSTGGNFAALAGSPSARFVVVQSNALVAFNTSANADAWAASDVGDYTNWTTGEAASGRILENNGPITGAIPYGNDIIVFKEDSIFRMTYVGGVVKWQIQRIYNGIGMADRQWYGSGISTGGASNGCSAVVETTAGLFFPGGQTTNGNSTLNKREYYLFDLVSPPRCLTIDVGVGTDVGTPVFDTATQTVTLFNYEPSVPSDTINTRYYYNLIDDAWGKSSASSAGQPHIPLRGSSAATTHTTGGGSRNRQFFTYAADKIVRNYANPPSIYGAHTSFIKSHKMSGPQQGVWGAQQWRFGPAAPILKGRNNSGITPSLSMTVDTFTESHDTSAAATATVSEATARDRFDFTKSDSFCQLKLSVTDAYIDIEDISCLIAPAGRV